MEFEWDAAKSNRCLEKRGFDFDFAVRLFDTVHIAFEDDRREYGEVRMIAIGVIEGRVFKVVYTDRSGVRRIISANRASRQEKLKWQWFGSRGT